MKTDPESVKVYIKKQVSERFAGITLNDLSDSEIEAVHASGERQILDIENVQVTCRQEPRRCSSAVDRLIIVMLDAIDANSQPLSLDDLRPVIATRERLGKFLVAGKENAAESARENPAFPLARELTGDLLVTYYLMSQGSGTLVTTRMLRKMGVTETQIDMRALENLKKQTTEPTLAPFPGHTGVYIIRSHFLASSELLIASRMDEFAKQIGAKDLAVGIPSSNVVFLADAYDAHAVGAVNSVVENHYKDYRGAVSLQILLYSRGSWGVYRPARPAIPINVG